MEDRAAELRGKKLAALNLEMCLIARCRVSLLQKPLGAVQAQQKDESSFHLLLALWCVFSHMTLLVNTPPPHHHHKLLNHCMNTHACTRNKKGDNGMKILVGKGLARPTDA